MADTGADLSLRRRLKKQRRRLFNRGAEALDDDELLETLLFTMIPSRRARRSARLLLKTRGSISAILASDYRSLREIPGLKRREIAFLLATREMVDRAAIEKLQAKPVLASWSELLIHVRLKLQHLEREQFHVMFLDRKNHLISYEVMGDGTVDRAPVYPREVTRRALELSASALILVHNHPSGDAKPSNADVSMTRELMDALTVFEIIVHDHLIVGCNEVVSMKTLDLI
ncbi:MAG: DNA repair protein RadC [Henriciella sp.]|nr:DNA repair protein RadC [Henriciella sp.]